MKHFSINYSKVKNSLCKDTIDLKVGIRGRYKLTKRKVSDNSVVEELEFDNLITNNGLELLPSSGAVYYYCQLGSGVTEPTVNDTALAVYNCTATMVSSPLSTLGVAPYTKTCVVKYSFTPGQITSTITEIGVGPSTTGNLFSRSLIKDSNGNASSISMLPDEYLDVVYTIFIYPPVSDSPFSTTLNGNTVTGFIRPLLITSNSYWQMVSNPYSSGILIQANIYTGSSPTTLSGSGTPSGSTAASTSTSVATYVGGSKRVLRTHNWSTAVGAFSIKSIVFAGNLGPVYAIEFDTPVSKAANQAFSITVSFSWDRV